MGDAARNARIMIVDDNVDVADTLSISLSRMGYQTTVFYEPLQAYDVFKKEPGRWDVVLTDQVMGPHRGLDPIGRLRGLRPNGIYILMTGYDENLTAGAAIEKGASAYFLKPLECSELAATMDRLLLAARRNTPINITAESREKVPQERRAS